MRRNHWAVMQGATNEVKDRLYSFPQERTRSRAFWNPLTEGGDSGTGATMQKTKPTSGFDEHLGGGQLIREDGVHIGLSFIDRRDEQHAARVVVSQQPWDKSRDVGNAREQAQPSAFTNEVLSIPFLELLDDHRSLDPSSQAQGANNRRTPIPQHLACMELKTKHSFRASDDGGHRSFGIVLSHWFPVCRTSMLASAVRVMNQFVVDLRNALNGDPRSLLHGEGMLGRLQFYERSDISITKVNHGLQVQCVRVQRDVGAEPPEDRAVLRPLGLGEELVWPWISRQ